MIQEYHGSFIHTLLIKDTSKKADIRLSIEKFGQIPDPTILINHLNQF